MSKYVTLAGVGQRQVSNIFCIGRNYAAHIAELNNGAEEQPIVFIKPTSSLCLPESNIVLPAFSNDVHFETELVLLVGKAAKNQAKEFAWECLTGIGIGLDLTARDQQSIAKAKGLPWALAKGFDNAACVSEFLPLSAFVTLEHFEFSMSINGELRQQGDTRKMLFDIPSIVHYLSQVFTLSPGDLIYTGTPEGVGPLHEGDQLQLNLQNQLSVSFSVAS